MFGLFRLNHQSTEASEPTSERLLADAAQFTKGLNSRFERLAAEAVALREKVLERLEGLSFDDKVSFLCRVQELSLHFQNICSVPAETLTFGSLCDLEYEHSVILLDEIRRFVKSAKLDGNEIAALAATYCQSMAIVCLAGSLADGREQKLDFITMKHDFGQQTGKLVGHLEYA